MPYPALTEPLGFTGAPPLPDIPATSLWAYPTPDRPTSGADARQDTAGPPAAQGDSAVPGVEAVPASSVTTAGEKQNTVFT